MNRNAYRIFFAFLVALYCALPGRIYAATNPSAPLRMLLIPMKPPSQMYRDFLPLKQYLEQRLQRPFEMDVARKNSEIARLFKEDKVDIAFICPTLYCDLTKSVSVSPLVKLRINGSDHYRSALVVREDSPIKRVADLMGQTLVYGRSHCPGSGLLPRIMMQRVGVADDDFFEVVNLGNDESALLAVMARMFDVTGVPEMAVHSITGNGLRVLRYSEPIPQYLFAGRSRLGKKLIDDIKEAMLDLNHSPNRDAIIGTLEKGVNGFTNATDCDYDIVRVLLESLNRQEPTTFRPGEHTLIVEPLYYDADLFLRLKPLLARLRSEIGWNFHLRIPKDIDSFMKINKQGKGDISLQESGLFSKFRSPQEELLGHLEVVPSATNVGIIVAASSGKITALQDLQGKRIGVPSRLSEGGYMAQTRWLQEQGVAPDAVRVVPLGTYENVLMGVYRGKVDAGYVTLDTFQRLQKDLQPGRIVILGKTPPLENWVVSARKEVPAIVKDKIRKILASLPELNQS